MKKSFILISLLFASLLGSCSSSGTTPTNYSENTPYYYFQAITAYAGLNKLQNITFSSNSCKLIRQGYTDQTYEIIISAGYVYSKHGEGIVGSITKEVFLMNPPYDGYSYQAYFITESYARTLGVWTD
jgi:hypothetical protein